MGGSMGQISAAVNIRPLVPAAMMTGSTIRVKVLMVLLLFAAGLPADLNTPFRVLRGRN